VVLVDESAQSIAAKNAVRGGGEAGNARPSLGWRQIETSMRSLAVVMIDIGGQH
jgi:hypothetical protein